VRRSRHRTSACHRRTRKSGNELPRETGERAQSPAARLK
jgi:hypothetical protein